MTQLDSTKLRIGDDERDEAIEALTTHSRQGRLTIDEYGERLEALNEARTRADVLALFEDLPEPRPTLVDTAAGTALARSGTAAPAPARSAAPEPADRPGRFTGAFLGVPVGAVAAAGVSYATGSWFFMFLAGPIAFAADRLSHRVRRERD
ncbi:MULTISPECIES: DUF1707 SHOCT-like domain-containing protein [Streptomyces]|uniref:DUF1707 SHOCT-like domain-containing protein n=1 Tax=Streptomyces TaxID=1883 RepID=UPI00163C2604|nr:MULTISPECIES: DUF1707 domain-containing protein [Streptomyces]MBC2876661.1 DUF1707 domain-containing protein [Streptomyces sp. TYQ1024]UBI36291.1 DUF1707 domain-containing protein [Streptomyces mobaraensis]UKW28885.1 DUF1707 domain-containing protein [Streptomyces sp. TYQ1024]